MCADVRRDPRFFVACSHTIGHRLFLLLFLSAIVLLLSSSLPEHDPSSDDIDFDSIIRDNTHRYPNRSNHRERRWHIYHRRDEVSPFDRSWWSRQTSEDDDRKSTRHSTDHSRRKDASLHRVALIVTRGMLVYVIWPNDLDECSADEKVYARGLERSIKQMGPR